MADITVRRLTAPDVDSFLVFRRRMLEEAPWAFAATVDDDVALARDFVLARSAEQFNATFLATPVGVTRPGEPGKASSISTWE